MGDVWGKGDSRMKNTEDPSEFVGVFFSSPCWKKVACETERNVKD